MYHDMINETIRVDSKAYKIEDMVKVILRKYPDMMATEGFRSHKDYVIEVTMSMDSGEQMSEMIRQMCYAIKWDKKFKEDGDDCGRELAARLFLVAVDLHPYYRRYLQ